ncbi:MAG: LarC family nickel insertion protein [Deltaproteobacteria bacterium]|nr:LarC family nickel insertion protein [Deltaproteobacteria bacterium]
MSRMRLQRVHLQPIGGIAGDMLLAALCDLGADRKKIARAFASLGDPRLELELAAVEVGGERALALKSIPADNEPEHRHLDEILALVDRADVSARARRLARRIFLRLAHAEAGVHGGTVADVHLHEVGQLDSVLDVLGIAVAFDSLGWPRLTSAPLPVGRGTVDTRHGRLTVPVPAVRRIAATARIPLVRIPVAAETVTPTGIAALAEICDAFVTVPRGKPRRVGIGAGTRRFADRPNILRAYGFARRDPGAQP